MQDPRPHHYASAGGVVVDCQQHRILVLLRPGRLAPDGRPEARLPKGHVEEGERPEAAALREVREESGLRQVCIVAPLGAQTVVFDWQDRHVVRSESFYLMLADRPRSAGQPEPQFDRAWLDWDEALVSLSFEAEREWVRRAQRAWHEIANRYPLEGASPPSARDLPA